MNDLRKQAKDEPVFTLAEVLNVEKALLAAVKTDDAADANQEEQVLMADLAHGLMDEMVGRMFDGAEDRVTGDEILNLTDLAEFALEEIELLKGQSRSWDEIAAIITSEAGKPVAAADLEKAYDHAVEEFGHWDDEFDDDDFDNER